MGGVFWKFWWGGPDTPSPPHGGGTLFGIWVLMGSRQGCIRVGGWVWLRFPSHPQFAAVSYI